MFQNQIVSTLQKILETAPKFPSEKDKGQIEYLNNFLGLALHSQYFFCGHELVLSSIFGAGPGKPDLNLGDFYDKYRDFIKFPYPKTAFEFTHNPGRLEDCKEGELPSSKTVCFIEDQGDELLLSTIDYLIPVGWRPSMEIIKVKNRTAELWAHAWEGSGYKFRKPELSVSLKGGFVHSIMCVVLLNCKNVSADLVEADMRLQAARRKRGKLPIFSYRTITIQLGKEGRRMNISKLEPLEHNRIHLCRGHFKHYTEERPLMGRHIGLFWWVPQVRGQNKDGIIVKDYLVSQH